MKRTAMLFTGLVLISAIVVAVACGSSDKKSDGGNSKTPAVATQTAVAKATIAAGGTPAASSDGVGNTAEPGSTQAIRDRAATQVAAVHDERTQEANDRATEDAQDAADAADEATRSASRDATRVERRTTSPNGD